jgi:ketosteroid isomerase-like protein
MVYLRVPTLVSYIIQASAYSISALQPVSEDGLEVSRPLWLLAGAVRRERRLYECDLVPRSARRLYAERKTRSVCQRHELRTLAPFVSLVGENLDFQVFESRGFVAQDDTVVVLGFERSLIKSTDRTFEQEWAHVYALRDGKVAKFLALEDTAAHAVALDATS